MGYRRHRSRSGKGVLRVRRDDGGLASVIRDGGRWRAVRLRDRTTSSYRRGWLVLVPYAIGGNVATGELAIGGPRS